MIIDSLDLSPADLFAEIITGCLCLWLIIVDFWWWLEWGFDVVNIVDIRSANRYFRGK